MSRCAAKGHNECVAVLLNSHARTDIDCQVRNLAEEFDEEDDYDDLSDDESDADSLLTIDEEDEDEIVFDSLLYKL